MSRIGKKPIIVPETVSLNLENNEIRAKGPKGEDSISLNGDFNTEIKENMVYITPIKQQKDTAIRWGTLRSRIDNLITGVEEGFTKQLEINGVGYQANIEGKDLNLKLGYSHPIIIPLPEDLEVKVEKNIITVSGISKERVGQLAALIKSKRPVEPYKGKGIHYVGERILRKAGKKVVGSGE